MREIKSRFLNQMTEASQPSPLFPTGKVPLDRRSFLKTSVLATAGFTFARLPLMAGPFSHKDFEKLVPADKKLGAAWLKSLTARGERTVYRGADLKKIGMPVGGVTCGQLYLGGDGKLWHWDIFNQAISTNDKHYAQPPSPASPVEQGFALRLTRDGKTEVRPLDQTGWNDISFIGEYPIGYVEYRDAAVPVTVALEAFSPFAPLNAEDSSLPATVMRFTVRNISAGKIEAELGGWLENAVCLHSGRKQAVIRRNRIVREDGFLFAESSAGPNPVDQTTGQLEKESDFGTMGLGLLDAGAEDLATASLAGADLPAALFLNRTAETSAIRPSGEKLIGAVSRKFSLAPGETATSTFVLTWNFPNLKLDRLPPGRHYATRFPTALSVAGQVAKNFSRLRAQTVLWHDTWYDSTLPYWFLDRTHLNISILATSTAFRFANGRFYGWEGVGCCAGTCTHVWQYEQAMGRLFPELDILLRERADFDPAVAFKPDGMIDHRGEFHAGQAVDGQAGTILRAYRDHQMSPDNAFLKRNYASIKKAMQWLIRQDGNADGILEGAQHNTLDAEWYGPVAWLSGLYLASLRAAGEMAAEMEDPAFAAECLTIAEAGRKNIAARLFNGEYFINLPDPRHPEAINSGSGCEIDQVLGQSWAWQVGLGRVLPEKETRSALQSLWRYNFSPDVGSYREVNRPGRWYAMAGEAGLLMCTFPQADWNYEKACGQGPEWATGYFNECMNGFEHQVAGHMIWEGMPTEGLAVERAVHDRYHASRRNPWNEVECGDHYARSMASYGVFIAACGFEYHGPKGHIGFSPRLTPESFKAPFTAAEGWGTFSQKEAGGRMQAEIDLKQGRLRLKTFALTPSAGITVTTARITQDGKEIQARLVQSHDRVMLTFTDDVSLTAGQCLAIELT